MQNDNRTLMATAAGISLVFLAASAGSATAATTSTAASVTASNQAPVVRTAVAFQDAHVKSGRIRDNAGSLTRLSARNVHGSSRSALVKFRVPAKAKGYQIDEARLSFKVTRSTAGKAVVRVTTNRWGGRRASYPVSAARSVVDRSALTAGRHKLTFDVTDAVHAGAVSFAVSTTKGKTMLRTETAKRSAAPRLVVTYKPKATGSTTSTSVSTTAPVSSTTPASAPAPVAAVAAAPAPRAATRLKIGMSAPAGEWSARLSETGSVDSRRIFGTLSSPSAALKLASGEIAAGRMPILSFKVPNNDWAGVGTGKYDTQLRDLTTKLTALGGQVFVTLHHEPTGDGTAVDYASMLKRALPILGAPATVSAGPIVNGFWWSNGNQGMTDAEIAQWLPTSVLKVSEVVAADTYQGGTTVKPGENAGVKIANMSKWAGRVGVANLGIGEYNGLNAASITAAGNALLADSRFRFAAAFNSNVNNRDDVSWQLTGDRLVAFKATVAKARAAK